MTIKGPVHENMVLNVHKYKGCQSTNPGDLPKVIAQAVCRIMEEDMGMPVTATEDEYKVGGGLFGSGSVSPAVVFRSKNHPEYATVFAAFKKTGALLEVTVAQNSPTSRNYQKTAQKKLFADKAAAEEEDSYYGAVTQAVDEAIAEVIG